MNDPTIEEMRAFLEATPFAAEADTFDREEAIYWFASDWHSGQWSNLYSALCQSDYHPGPNVTGIDPESVATWLYEALEAEYAT